MKLAKNFVLFFLLLLPMKILFAQEMLAFLDGDLSFQRPQGVTLWEERPSMADPNHQNFWWGRIQLRIALYDSEALRGRASTLMTPAIKELANNNDYLTRNALLGLFTAKPEFAIIPCTPRLGVRKSYKQLMVNGTVIGETFFHTNAQSLEARGNFGYITSIIVENQILTISLSLFTGEEDNPLRELDGYTVTRNGSLFWIDNRSQISFYEHLSSDRYTEMPLILRQLREAYDFILQALEIRQDGSDTRMNVELISPQLEFRRTHTTMRNLRLQERIDDNAPTILDLPEGTDVQVIMTSDLTDTRAGIPFPWVVVTTREGIIGYVFSGFLREDSIGTSVAVEGSPVTAKDNSVTGGDTAATSIAHDDSAQNISKDIVVKQSGNARLWLLLLLLIPIIFLAVFAAKKRSKA